jgi:hypothetical protein
MNDFQAQVDDLALFFRDDDGSLGMRWLTHSVYTEPQLEMDSTKLPEGWEGSLVREVSLKEGGSYHIVNLSCLLAPGTRSASRAHSPLEAKRIAESVKQTPTNGDIVVIPFDQPNMPVTPHLIPHDLLRHLPPIERSTSSDLVFMALDEGVVLANLPKIGDLRGYTCYVLSLVALRSGALPGVGDDNREVARNTLAALGKAKSSSPTSADPKS